MRSFLCIVFLLILNLSSLYAEDYFSQLQLKGYELDIETSTESSLLAWINRLGLAEAGSIDEMKKLLYTFYSIESPEYATIINKTELVVIHSADTISITGENEAVAILSGNVIIEVSESETENLYMIHAEQIVLNNSTNIVTASGSVHLLINNSHTGAEIESYFCSKFALSIKNWDGIFVDIETTSSRENSSGDTITFSLTGGSVYKSDKGMLIIDDGIISSGHEDPLISIRADTISLLSEGDWFADQAFLYLGRVPVFYLPFFFSPGMDFFFNPSFGFSADRGIFVNTTTVIFGSIPEVSVEKTSFSSFLQGNELSKNVVAGIQGSILEMYYQGSDILTWAEKTHSYLTVNFDVYEQAGIVFGADAEFNDISFLRQLSFRSAIAINVSSSDPLLRFLIEPKIKIDNSGFKFSISLPFYSDDQVLKDYAVRKTRFDLDDVTGIAQFPASASTVDSFNWEFKGSITPNIDDMHPIIEQFEISTISSQIEWKLPLPWNYEIQTISLLTHAANMSGKLFSGSFKTGSLKTGSLKKENDLDLSEGPQSLNIISGNIYGNSLTLLHESEFMIQDTEKSFELSEVMDPIILPDKKIPILSISTKQLDEYFQYRFSYDISNSGNIDIVYDTGSAQYRKIVNRLESKIMFTGSFFDKAVLLRNTLKPSGYVQWHDKISESVSDWAVYVDHDRERTKFALYNELFAGIPEYGVSYILKTRLLTYNYDYDMSSPDYLLSPFIWGKDDVLQHSITASIPFPQLASTFSVSMTLPPGYSGFKPKLEIKSGDVSVSLYTSFSENGSGIWQYDPLYVRLSLQSRDYPFSGALIAEYDYSEYEIQQNVFSPLTLLPNFVLRLSDNLRLSQKLFIDFDRNMLERSTSRIDFWESYAELFFLFDDIADGGNGAIIPAKFKMYSDINLNEFSFWKNRVVLSTDILSIWDYNFREPSDNILSVSFQFNLRIEEFLDISIVSKSRNTATHHYLDGSINIIEDLLKSFNFFNIDDRYDSNFNLSEVEMHIVHYMKDWDLNFEYSGEIALNSDNEYKWSPQVSIYITWKTVPEIDLSASIEHDTITGIQ